MDNRPIHGLEDLENHLELLLASPETPVDAKLLDDVELQLTDANIPPLIPRLLPKITEILPIYQQDPAHLVSIAIKLLKPVKFKQAMTLASEDSLILALQSPAPSANMLALAVIEKASNTPGDVAILSIMKDVVDAFLHTWLSCPNVEVGGKATRVLGDLLDMDCDQLSNATLNATLNGKSLSLQPQSGQGLLWRRIFHDKEIYSTILSLCSSSTIGAGIGQLDERQKSLAQARLLRILPRLASLDFGALTRSHFPEVDSSYGLLDGKQGLLFFAALSMVDKQDLLMHITLIDFFREFLDTMSMTDMSGSTVQTLVVLMREATKDAATLESLTALAESESSSEELVELLSRLNEHR